MRQITLTLPDALYTELEAASASVREHGFTPETWAQEAVESALATRRLPSVQLGSHGPHARRAIEEEAEPECYPVRFPEERESL
jgi:hypothetical protein